MYTVVPFSGCEYLADSLIERNPSYFRGCTVEMWHFPDGTPTLSFPSLKDEIEHKEVVYLWDFSRVETLFDQYNILFNLVKNSVESLTIFMPYFPVGTSERVEKKWETESAHAFAHLLSSLPSWLSTKNRIHIFDIHALVEQSLFDPERLHAEIHTTTSLLELLPEEKIVFPDDGAAKRFRYAFEEYPDRERIICSKVRNGSEKHITIKEWNPEWCDVVIVDDLIQSGSTLIETARILRSAGARRIRAFASHGIFPSEAHIRIAREIDTLIVTDSLPINRIRAASVSNMEILSLTPLIEKILCIPTNHSSL